MRLSDTSLRTRLIIGPALNILVLLAICAMVVFSLADQERFVDEVNDKAIGRATTVTGFLARLSTAQLALSDILTKAAGGQANAESIFEEGRKTIDSVRELSATFGTYRPMFEGDANLLELFVAAEKEMQVFRTTIISVVQMATADPDLASAQMIKVSGSYTRLVDQMQQVLALTGRRISADLTAMAHGSERMTISMTVVAGLSMVGLLLLSLFFYRSIARTIEAIIDVMDRLSRNELDVEVPNRGRSDQIGAIARAVQIFKENAIEMRALNQRVEDERRKRDADREEQEATLNSALGQVVNAAAAGDLSVRIQTDSLSGVMRSLGDELNTLLNAVANALTEIGEVMAGLAAGDLTRRATGQYTGMFGAICSNMNGASDRLADTVREITRAADMVNNAAGEISSVSSDLAQRTESQAASLEQTAAAVHQITATVKQNAGNASAASQLAVTARDLAVQGGTITTDAIAAMQRIEDSAVRIGDIVGLIDEIAFQTNLLALNASVEAARAGEAGKGFAVVAQEVRSLAQRSANASRDIKSLVLESNGLVKNGTTLVNNAGQSLQNIVSGSKKVTDIVAEITAASQEQAAGLEQVNIAVGGLDEMTQRNGALVEEAAASAAELAQQADTLAKLVRQFRI